MNVSSSYSTPVTPGPFTRLHPPGTAFWPPVQAQQGPASREEQPSNNSVFASDGPAMSAVQRIVEETPYYARKALLSLHA
jgi:hypothetical protein